MSSTSRHGTLLAGEPVVVKLGGETLAEQHDALRSVAAAAAERRLIVVHGGGKRLSGWLARLGIESRWQDGRRVTDDATLEAAAAVLGGLVNAELVAALERLEAPAAGLTGIDAGLLAGERVPGLGRVVRVAGVRPHVLDTLLDARIIPVVAPLALDADGAICNVNADEVAAGLAGTLGARLVLLSDTDGVRDEAGRTIERLDRTTAESLIAAGVIEGGMIPKVRAALDALAGSARAATIADGRDPEALARILHGPGSGTRVVAG